MVLLIYWLSQHVPAQTLLREGHLRLLDPFFGAHQSECRSVRPCQTPFWFLGWPGWALLRLITGFLWLVVRRVLLSVVPWGRRVQPVGWAAPLLGVAAPGHLLSSLWGMSGGNNQGPATYRPVVLNDCHRPVWPCATGGPALCLLLSFTSLRGGWAC
jgi:hypothetical protein